MGITTPKAMQVSNETQPLRKKYRVGLDYKNQKSKPRTNQSNAVHKGDRWRTVKAASRRGTNGNNHLK